MVVIVVAVPRENHRTLLIALCCLCPERKANLKVLTCRHPRAGSVQQPLHLLFIEEHSSKNHVFFSAKLCSWVVVVDVSAEFVSMTYVIAYQNRFFNSEMLRANFNAIQLDPRKQLVAVWGTFSVVGCGWLGLQPLPGKAGALSKRLVEQSNLGASQACQALFKTL